MKKRKMQINQLRNHYSDFVFSFLNKYANQLDTNMTIGDIGAGHLRNLKLFAQLHFKNLYAVDRENTDNPLSVNLKKFILHNIEEGIPCHDNFFDITLCNYVLMFINEKSIDFVLNELMRVSNGFILIETNKKNYESKTTSFKDYNFKYIADYISNNNDFKVLKRSNYQEKLLVRRVKENGKRK